ncbi:MAG: hypothetical protein IPL84_00570 [Chitinophagaceae bacterium]|nr:hypothetical protein [Chitinophagaceae bacterium]
MSGNISHFVPVGEDTDQGEGSPVAVWMGRIVAVGGVTDQGETRWDLVSEVVRQHH